MTANFVTLGRYLHGDSAAHRLDARAKLIAAFFLASAVLWSKHAASQLLVCVLLLLACFVARLPRAVLGRTLLGAAWLILFVIAANALWFWLATQVSWADKPVGIRSYSEFATLLARLLNLLLVAVLFTSTTVPVDAAEALQSLLSPLKRLRLPVHEVSLLLSLSLSFIPIFLDEAGNLARAHRMKRGLARWGWRDRLSAAVPLMVPLFLTVLRRSDELALAMESRCYAPGQARSSLVPHRTGRPEIMLLLGCTLVVVLLAWL